MSNDETQDLNIVDQIIDYETGMMEEEDVPGFFQKLYDTKILYSLRGSYQRAFSHLLAMGLVSEG